VLCTSVDRGGELFVRTQLKEEMGVEDKEDNTLLKLSMLGN
jgi:hypothetical protein